VLVVDDEPHITDFIGLGLGREGYRTTAAADGIEALRLAQDDAPDLVVLDVMLPGMDGSTFAGACGRIRMYPFSSSRPETRLKIACKGWMPGGRLSLQAIQFCRAIGSRARPSTPAGHTCWFSAAMGHLRANTATREVWRGAEAVGLTAREFRPAGAVYASPAPGSDQARHP